MVADVCRSLSVPHSTLTVDWKTKPQTAIQERARLERYRLLGQWAEGHEFAAIATGHHLDDQAETLLMRLTRGAGVTGLAGMRADAPLPGSSSKLLLLRPLLGWRRSELAGVCNDAGVRPAEDPSNSDEQFERVRVRRALAAADWLDAEAIARSAGNLASADEALDWGVEREWESQVSCADSEISYHPRAPLAVRQRVVRRAVIALSTEGAENEIRGRELDQLVAVLSQGGTATLRGVRCSGGDGWRFTAAPARRPTR